METWSEPDYSREDRLHEPPLLLNATLTVSGLSVGAQYALLRYDSPGAIPSRDLLGQGGYVEKKGFTSAGASRSWPVSFLSNSTTLL
jgi:hypothetical protein